MSAPRRLRVSGAHGPWGRPLALLFVACLAVAGCDRSDPDPELPEDEELSLEALGRVGGEIYNEPERVEDILDAVGLTSEEFQERVRTITNDPVLAREYSRGFEAVARPPDPPSPVDAAPPPSDPGGGGVGGP